MHTIRRASAATALSLVLASSMSLIVAVPARALTVPEAAHLAGRTGFGPAPDDLLPLLPLSREPAVDRLLASLDDDVPTRPPAFVSEPRPNYHAPDWLGQKNIVLRLNELAQLQDWWLDQMIATRSPFREHMVLFWHNIFTSRVRPTLITAPCVDQLALYRSVGTGDYRMLIVGVLHDPMMLSFLDNETNTRAHPNENLARELLELFTLGAGHYSEDDIKQLARVLAGHHVGQDAGWAYRLDQRSVDPGPKQVLGRTISGSPEAQVEQLADAILAQPQAADYLAGRMYREFVSSDADPKEVQRIAAVLRENHYQLRPALRAMLTGDAFWAPRNRGALVKSPVELVVGFARTFGLRSPDAHILNTYTAYLGQELLDPPNVAGWRGGNDWITAATLGTRRRVIDRLWAAKAVMALEDKDSRAQGLRVRFSSESDGKPAHFRVLVDGVSVGEGTARYGLESSREAPSNDPNNLKAMWETLFVPRSQLPPRVRQVVIEPLNLGGDTHMFVNWVEIDGIRMSPLEAHAQPGGSAECLQSAPAGMLYCNAPMVFDWPAGSEAADRSLGDRSAPLNSQIEYGTGRLALTGIASVRPDVFSITNWKCLDADGRAYARSDANKLRAILLRTPPMVSRADRGADEALIAYARRLTEDPAYNLK